MSATKLSPYLSGVVSAEQVEIALEARRMRSLALAALIADGIVAIGSGVKTLTARLKGWHERRMTLNELDGLDDRTLADIGLSRGEIAQVAAGHYVRQADDYGFSLKALNAANTQGAQVRAA